MQSASHPGRAEEGFEEYVNAKSQSATSKALNGSSSKGMWMTLTAIAGIIVIAVVAVVIAAQNEMGPFKKEAVSLNFAETADSQISIADDGAVTVGNPDAPKIDVWEDFMCPACANMEEQYGPQITEAVTGGDLQVTHHYVNFLDQQSAKGDYSTRMIAAAQCVAVGEDLQTYLDARTAWFTNAPAEGGGDRTQSEIADDAKEAGAGDESVKCIEGIGAEGGDNVEKASSTAEASQQAMQDSGLQMATPTVAKDGEQIELQDPTWLQKAIDG